MYFLFRRKIWYAIAMMNHMKIIFESIVLKQVEPYSELDPDQLNLNPVHTAIKNKKEFSK